MFRVFKNNPKYGRNFLSGSQIPSYIDILSSYTNFIHCCITQLPLLIEYCHQMGFTMNRGTSVAAAYYNDPNVTNFYRLCWGGSDIHIGKYATGDESVAVASTAMTQHLLELAKVKQGEKVIDIACG